jgi:hypothetical protein
LLSHRTGILEYLQYRNPLKKVDKSWKLPIAYLMFNIYTYLIFGFFTGPLAGQMYEIWLIAISCGMASVFWLVTMSKDPGFIKPHKKVDFLVRAIRF